MGNSKMIDPTLPWDTRRWLTEMAAFCPAEKGVLVDLICYQHIHGILPSDTTRLARIVGIQHEEFLSLWEGIKHLFETEDDHLVYQLVNQILTNSANRSLRNTISGTFASIIRSSQYSPEERNYLKDRFKTNLFFKYKKNELKNQITNWCTNWLANGNQVGIPNGKMTDIYNSNSIYTENDDTGKKKGVKGEEGRKKKVNIPFEHFWSDFAKKVDRKACEREWLKLSDQDREDIMTALPAYILSTPEIQYRRNPLKYLKSRHWESQVINHNGKSRPGVTTQAESRSDAIFSLVNSFNSERHGQ